MKIYDASAQNFGAILCLMDYNEKELLVGTDNGLYLFNRDLKHFVEAILPLACGHWAIQLLMQ